MVQMTERKASSSLPDTARTSFEESRRKASEMEQGLEAYIRQNPIRALAYAAGAGVLLALLFGRR
jgi:ElaB/YqjD/DUF883 family membrane-anchored ribosome-binding protein